MGDYPWLASWCADIDITGQRRALSYLRETVFGLRSEPYISVRDPKRHGASATHLGLAGEPWLEGLASWSWPGFEGRPVTVDVMSDADEVELLVNGTSLGRQPAGQSHRFRTTFETTFEPGEIVAVAYWRGGRGSPHAPCNLAAGWLGSTCGLIDWRSAPTTPTLATWISPSLTERVDCTTSRIGPSPLR